MLDSLLLYKKAIASDPSLVMALDFDGTVVKDSVNTSRAFTNGGTGGSLVLSNAQFKNGSQSLYQSQVSAGASTYLTTTRTSDLTFAGDFWFEVWGYCLGQGNPTYTGGFNTILSYGAFQGGAGVWRWHIDNLKPALRIPSGTTDTGLMTSSIAVGNNAWNHYALGRFGSTTSLWVNGALGVSTTTALGTIGFGSNLNIAGYNDSRLSGSTYAGFNGYLDRLRIYNKCLNTAPFTPSSGSYPN